MSTGPINPPFPTNDGGIGATEQPIANTYSPESDLDNRLAWAQKHTQDLGALIQALQDESKQLPVSMGWAVKGIGWILNGVLEFVNEFEATYLKTMTGVLETIMPDAEEGQGAIFGYLFPVLEQLMTEASGPTVSFGSSPLSLIAEAMYQGVIQPFSLTNNAADPTQVGSGIQNQQYLLSQSLGLAVAEWFISSVSQYTGAGFLKTFAPLFEMITMAVNPYNAVRMAMEYSYRFFIQQPLTRDLNRAYPIKDLGLTALAKMYIRGIIDEQTYLDRALDSGINNTQAQQLLLEAAKLPSTGQIAKLINLGVMTEQEAIQALQQDGWTAPWATAVTYLDTHERYFALQERVGNAAITALKRGYIDQPRFEALMSQLGYTGDEITLLEIEEQFTKAASAHGAGKTLSLGELKRAYDANLIGIDDVITRLEAEGYNAQDVQTLVLLDFTEAAERQARMATLQARLRVAAEQARITAAAATAKNETALATAKAELAGELDAEAKLLGAITTVPSVLALLGSIP